MGKYVEKITSYTKEELCDIFEPVYMNVMKSYNFINIGNIELKSIVMKVLDDCFDNLDESKAYNFDILFLEKFTDSINKYFSKMFEDSKVFVSVLSDFVSKNINFSENYRDNLKSFEKLSSFFEKIDFVPDINLCVEFLNNNSLVSAILEEIVDKNLKKIKNDGIDSLFKSLVSISFIESYCMVHNIEIADFYDDDYSSDDYYTEDSIETYLKEMGSFPLLSRDEERKLARLISQGDKKAKDTFLKSNLRLVVSIAYRLL